MIQVNLKNKNSRNTILAVHKIVILLILCFSNASIVAQDFEKIKEAFTFYPNKKKAEQDSTLYLHKLITAPIITYSPETSLGLGLGAKYLFKFKGSGDETRTSNMPISARYTLKNQFILYSGFEMFTNNEDWVIEGNIRFQNYPRLYYGIGRDTPEEYEEEYDYFQGVFEPIFLKRLFTRYLFIGGGIRYNHIFNTETEENGLLETTMPSGFDGSTSAGVELALLYDSRDNILNASSGWYFEFTEGFYRKALGGTHKFNLTRFDLRHFLKVSSKNNDVLAFQAVGHFTSGDVPFSELALFGSSEIMRGYIEGRYVERNMIAGQVEYRKSFKDTRLGMVAFIGTGDVFNKAEQLKLNNLRPNFGLGIRFLLDKEENLNIRLDWGLGDDSNNFYLDIAEAF